MIKHYTPLLIFILTVLACNTTPRNQSQPTETTKTDSEVTTRKNITNVVRKGNRVTFDYKVIASKEDLATESKVIADCKTLRYQTTYWAITKKGVPIMKNDETTALKRAEGDMKATIEEVCEN